MARLRRQAGAPAELRARLAAKYRNLLELYGHVTPAPGGGVYCSPWPAKIAALEAGEPVELHGWEVLGSLEGDGPRPHPNDAVRLEPDGSLTILRRAL